MPRVVLVTAGIAVLLFALDRVGVWAEKKGWVYWRHRNTSSSAGAMVLGPLTEVFQPSYSHVVEEERRLLAGAEQATGDKGRDEQGDDEAEEVTDAASSIESDG